jgi:glycosyltransferase involved in cell wall biosynthesis
VKVAVLTVRSASGVAGGAERLFDALVDALKQIGHDAHEVPVSADESTFDDILGNYLHCYDIDLSGYDVVISTKAPTWMVRHPRHVCYLVHTIRVFYDMYDSVFPAGAKEPREQRDLVHRMDNLALAQPSCRRIFSIGSEVSERLRRWNGLDAEVLHPPLWSDAFHGGAQGDYLFLPGRLHPWKRVDLVIRAMKHVRAPLRLLISGTGEAESELRDLAGGDSRIEFLGRVSDEDLIKLYAGAFAVPFAPMSEDYGYVTLEAFASGKPVITCTDSGEAASIVQHGVSGYVCKPDPKDLGQHIDLLWEDHGRASDFGQAGLEWIGKLSWPDIATKLIEASEI